MPFRRKPTPPKLAEDDLVEITKCDFLLAYACLKSGGLETDFLVPEELAPELEEFLNTTVVVSAESFRQIEGLNLLEGLEYSRNLTGMEP